MIEFIDLEWKNLLSYGNNKNTFNFKTGIFKIEAKNGMGKSTIVEAIYFALFGKPYRKIKIKQLINSKNKKGMEVYLTFRKQEDIYRVERGLKPDFFRIYKNDEIVPVSSSKRGYQEILTEDILGFNENLANQVMIKSLTKSVAFMTLDKADKRSVIENLFDIEIFTVINKNTKIRADKVESELKDVKKDLDNLNLLIDQEMANLETLRNLQKRLKQESDQIIAGFESEIVDLEESNRKFTKGIEIINKNKEKKKLLVEQLNKLKLESSKLTNKINEASATIKANEKKVEYLLKVCGECPKIGQLMKDDSVVESNTIIASCNELLKNIEESASKLTADITKIDEILSNERFVVTSLQTNTSKIDQLQAKIKTVKEKVITVDESKLKGYNIKKSELSVRYNQLADDKKHLLILRGLFSDDGIKPLIIKKYLPSINRLLNTYLAKFSSNMIFNFDTDFNEVILTRHKEDYSYYNFSEGEKKRIDLAILFTFIKFAMHKNKKSNTNLLIFDEIMSGLDALGSTALFDILKDHKDYQNKCILTINHNSSLDDCYFDGSFEVINEKGFSKILESK